MSSFVTLSKDGLLQHEWDRLTENFIVVPVKDPVLHLRSEVSVEEDFTLGDLFKIVSANKELTSFISRYSWCKDIDNWHKQLDDKAVQKSKADCSFAEVYWAGYVHSKSKHLDIKSGFHSVAVLPSGNKEYSSLSDTKLSSIRDLQLIINSDLPVYTGKGASSRYAYLCEYKKRFSLLDVLDAIYWDISYYGGPDEASSYYEHEIAAK